MQDSSLEKPGVGGLEAGGRIVCGTDFSAGARRAAEAAAALARRRSLPLVLVHVVEQSLLDLLPAEMRRSLLDSSQGRLEHDAEVLRGAGTRVEERFLVGASEDLLVSEAQGAALVVLASLGARPAARWLVGSVTDRVAERAPAPTWVVRDAAPLLAWAGGQRPLRVLVAFNLTASAEAALRWAGQLRQWGPCEFVVAYADWPPEERERLGTQGMSPLTANPPEMQRLLDRDVRARADAVLGPGPVRVRVQANWGRPESCLADMAQAEGVDVVVVGSHQRHGLVRWWYHSVSRGLLHQARMGVAVVPGSLSVGLATTPSYRRVLVATDFSAVGDRAIPHGFAAARPGSTVKLVHVTSASSPGEEGPAFRRVECLRRLRERVPADAAARGVACEVEVLEHVEVGEALCQEAERFAADLVCLGTQGRSGVREALLGSVSHHVVARGRRPVLLVPPPTP